MNLNKNNNNNNIKFLIAGGYADIYIDKLNNIVYKTFYNPCRNEIIYSWLKEIMFLSELSHKNIMKLLDIKFNNSLINNYITQENFVDINTSEELYIQYYKNNKSHFKPNLKSYMKTKYNNLTIKFPYYDCIVYKKIFTDDEVITCMKGLFNGLEYCHYMGIVHRDIKLNNLFYEVNEKKQLTNIIIGDFGLSHTIITGDSINNMLSNNTTTYTHRAPEIFNSENYDEKIDVWSCGICLIFFIMGYNLSELFTMDQYFLDITNKIIQNKKNESFNKSYNTLEEIYKAIVTSSKFKETTLKLISSNCKKKNKLFYIHLLNSMIEPDPYYRLSMKELNKLINMFYRGSEYIHLEKKPLYIYNWIEDIYISNENNKKSISIILNILHEHNFTKIQKRFIINKTIKLINLYSNFFKCNKINKIFIISCLQIILYITYSCSIQIKYDADINENIKNEISIIIEKLYCNKYENPHLLFPIPIFYK